MSRSNLGPNLLAIFMLLVGGASLFACIYLPPWLELRELRAVHAEEQRRVADLEDRLTRLVRQIEHIQDDPAYVERLARREFGITTPGVEVIPVQIPPEPNLPEEPDAAEAPAAEAFAGKLELAARVNPLVRVFVLDATRPVVMGMAGVVMIVALFLLTRTASKTA